MNFDENIEAMISSLNFDSSGSRRETRVQELMDIANERSRQLERVETLTTKLQAECKASRDKLSQLEKERSSIRKELTKLKDDDASVSKKLEKLQTEVRDAKFKIKGENQKSCINAKEQEILHQNEVELNAYKNLTGVRWNFDVPENTIEGLITNSKTKYVKVFNLQKTVPSKKIRETLWSYIKEAGSADYDQLENKENQH